MTNKVSLDKSKIKFVLLEGVHQSALDTLHAAGYTNIDFYKKALDGDELKEAIKDGFPNGATYKLLVPTSVCINQ